METKITAELMRKLKSAKSEEEIISLAKDDGVELEPSDAQTLFNCMNEITDEELTDVTGGTEMPFPIPIFTTDHHAYCNTCGHTTPWTKSFCLKCYYRSIGIGE